MVITTCWPGQLEKMHQNGLASTVAFQRLFRQWGVLSVFTTCRCWRGRQPALRKAPWSYWFTSGMATALQPDTKSDSQCSYRARTVWLQHPHSWLHYYSAFTWLQGSILERWCEQLYFPNNHVLPRSEPHLSDLPLGFTLRSVWTGAHVKPRASAGPWPALLFSREDPPRCCPLPLWTSSPLCPSSPISFTTTSCLHLGHSDSRAWKRVQNVQGWLFEAQKEAKGRDVGD